MRTQILRPQCAIPIILVSCILTIHRPVQAQPAPPELFAPAAGYADPSAGDPTVIRSRAVHVNLTLLGAVNPQDTLTLNLFEDATYLGVFEEKISRGTDRYTWFGLETDDAIDYAGPGALGAQRWAPGKTPREGH